MASACPPDLISDITHGGMAVSVVVVATVFLWLRRVELWTDAEWALTYAFYGAVGLLSFFVSADLFRWAVRVILL